MSQKSLESYGAYQKALELFTMVANDMEILRNNPLCWKLVSQQVGSCDSIAANIEEGFGRLSKNEYIRFLDFSRASARETRGRYIRMKQWLPHQLVDQRTRLLDEIIGILTSSIQTLRTQGGYTVRETEEPYLTNLIQMDVNEAGYDN